MASTGVTQSRWVQRFNCGLCDELREFTQQAHCERHMTSVHSGFTFLCGECNLTMTRVDQRHGCERKALYRVKRETLTMTPEEAREFEKFQQERVRHVIPFMKELPLVFSDQPYKPNQFKRKRARLTEPHYMKKARKQAAARTIAHTITRPTGNAPTAAIPAAPQVQETHQAPSRASTHLEPPRDPQYQDPQDQDPKDHYPEDQDTKDQDPKDQDPQDQTRDPLTRTFKRLFGDNLSESEEEEDNGPLMSPDVSISEPVQMSTPSRIVLVSREREFDKEDRGTQTQDVADSETGPLEQIRKMQKERIEVIVGGRSFTTSVMTLTQYPDSLIAKMITSQDIIPFKTTPDGMEIYFLDRDPEYFPVVLHFLRDGPNNIQCHLPTDPLSLRKVHMEAVFYGLFKLASIVAHKICSFMMGADTFSFLEE